MAGSVRSAVLLLALPVLGEQMLNSAVGLFDTFLAGTISASVLSAVGFAAYVDWLVSILFGLAGTGATALVARAVGAGDTRLARRTTNQAVMIGLGLGAVSAISVYFSAGLLSRGLGLRGEAFDVTVMYLRLVALGHVAHCFTAVGSACLRGAGNTITPMWIYGATNVVNVIVSSVLVFGLGGIDPWGVSGIAAGTVTARFVGGLITVAVLRAGVTGLSLTRRDLRPDPPTIRRILRIGGPALVDGGFLWMGHFLFMAILTRMGTEEASTHNFSAHIVGIRIESLSYLPAVAWATAAATLVGQGLGAGQAGWARRAGHEAALQGTILIGLVGVIYYVFAPELFRLFTTYNPNAEAQAIGVPAMRLLAFFQPALALTIIYVGALRGAGDTRYPMMFTVLSITLVRLPLAYVGGHVLDGGLVGAWVGMCADLVVRAGLAAWRFTRGRWDQTRV